jgi:hypothetical protein
MCNSINCRINKRAGELRRENCSLRRLQRFNPTVRSCSPSMASADRVKSALSREFARTLRRPAPTDGQRDVRHTGMSGTQGESNATDCVSRRSSTKIRNFVRRNLAGGRDVESCSGPRHRTAIQRRPDSRAKVVIGHSLGSVVAYEALCQQPAGVVSFITLGSPLGIRNVIFEKLTPRPSEGALGHWPGNVRYWTNIADSSDVVALEKRLSPVLWRWRKGYSGLQWG